MEINFLKSERKKFVQIIVTRTLYVFTAIVVVWGLIYSAVLFSAEQFLKIQDQALQRNIKAIQSREKAVQVKELESEIIAVNRNIDRMAEISKKQSVEFETVLNRLSQIVPAGSNLMNVSYAPKTKLISINGHARTRTQVIQIEDALSDEPLFSLQEPPISNLTNPRDINFEFQFTVNKKESEL